MYITACWPHYKHNFTLFVVVSALWLCEHVFDILIVKIKHDPLVGVQCLSGILQELIKTCGLARLGGSPEAAAHGAATTAPAGGSHGAEHGGLHLLRPCDRGFFRVDLHISQNHPHTRHQGES